MSSRMQPAPSQDSLFVVAERTGQLQVRNLSELDGLAAVDRVEQKLNLINTISYLAGASMRDGLRRSDGTAVTATYGNNSSSVLAGAEAKRIELLDKAKWSFARATGQLALSDAGVMPPEDQKAQKLTRGMFSDFLKRYYGPLHYQEAHAFSRSLASGIDDIYTTYTLHNRLTGQRPHKVESETEPLPATVTAAEKQESRLLDSRSRLEAILYDPRAGYIAASNIEKTMVMSFLDYLDNPEYPLGVNNQLFEVAVHQQRAKRIATADAEKTVPHAAYGIRAVESITWEIGDYLADAAQGYRLLAELKTAMQGVFPAVTLEEEFGLDTPAVAYLIRYSSLQKFIEKGERDGLKDPLRGKTVRFVGTRDDPTPGRRKQVYSHFVAPNRPVESQTFIEAATRKMTHKQAARLIDEAIDNEHRRGMFMWHRLQEIQQIGPYRSLNPVRDAVSQSLEVVKDEPLMQLLRGEHAEAA